VPTGATKASIFSRKHTELHLRVLLQRAPLSCSPAITYRNFHLLARGCWGRGGAGSGGGGGSQTGKRSTRISNVHLTIKIARNLLVLFSDHPGNAATADPRGQRQYFAVTRHTTLIRILQPVAAGNLETVGAAPAPVVPPYTRPVNTVSLPSTYQFSTTGKTKECVAHRQTDRQTKLLAIPYSVPYQATTFHKSNASITVHKTTLFSLATGLFIALGAYECTTRTVSVIQDNRGFTNDVTYYILYMYNYIPCWHNCSLSWMQK
jgi:hypothetical protein